ncbi:MAG TPA: PLDc N-terminal domain-containing protein [Dermatophilaceae bacterium]|nr:PLDc N-terminal domain-containing protein [Dermatophilaceae bacterium]
MSGDRAARAVEQGTTVDFWDILWFILISFAFIAYLMVMFNIITDLFRDDQTSGIVKAIWIVALIFLPFLTALIYLIVRGSGMSKRQAEAAQRYADAQQSYIKSVAGTGTSPTEQITHAKSLLDSGTISQAEFDSLKAKALA